jgi:hypothetical protein
MPASTMLVNGQDLAAYGMWIQAPAGWGDAPPVQDRTVDIRGAGSAIIPSAGRIGERQFSVEGMISASSFAAALALWDQAKLLLSSTWLEVLFTAAPDRVCICRYQGIQWQPVNMVIGGFRFSMSFLAPSAYMVAPLVDTYGLSAGVDQPIALGTAPSPFLVELIGPATSPTLSYYDAGGTRQGNVHLLGSLLTNEWMRFDSQTFAMERHTGTGIVNNGAPFLANDSQLFQLDPADGVAGRGPVLALDSGTALVLVRKAYL